MDFDFKQASIFKSIIEDIVAAQLKKQGISTYVAAVVSAVNQDGTVDVILPPDTSRVVSSVLNKTKDILKVGDSVELCTKNGRLSNCWVAIKHGMSDAGIVDTVDWDDIINKPNLALKDDIPTKLSEIENDVGFVTNAVNNLLNYYVKNEVYSKDEINNLISSIPSLSISVVQSLPATGKEGIIYLTPKVGTENDVYNEYIWVNAQWELIGNTEISLSDYYNKTEINGLLDNKVDKVDGKGLSSNDFTSNYITQISSNSSARHVHDNKNILDNITAPYTSEEQTKLSGIENNANYYVLPTDVVKDSKYVHTDNNYTTTDKNKLDGLENYDDSNVLSAISSLEKDKVDKINGKGLSTNDFTDDYKSQISANTTDRHKHNNKDILDATTASYTINEQTKLSGIEDNANYYVLPSDVVQDSDYVHTDNNYTTNDKDKLEGLENYDDTRLNEDIQYIENNLATNYLTADAINNVIDIKIANASGNFVNIGTNNELRNTGLWFIEDSGFEFWSGIISRGAYNTKQRNGYTIILGNGSCSQAQSVINGNYTISFKYDQLTNASASIKINGNVYQLKSGENNNFLSTIYVTENYITIEFIGTGDNCYQIYNLMVNAGELASPYNTNKNEIHTSTIGMSKGLTVFGDDVDVNIKNGIKVKNSVIDENGMQTDVISVTSNANIVGVAYSRVGNQTFITGVEV